MVCCNPFEFASKYVKVLHKTPKDDWTTIFSNFGLIEALILSACYGVSGWIDYPDLEECGLAGKFYTYVTLVQQPGLVGVVSCILLIQLSAMAAVNEKAAPQALSDLLPMFVLGVIVNGAISVLMGCCIVWVDELVHQCQYKIEHGTDLHFGKAHPEIRSIALISWAVMVLFGVISIASTVMITANHLDAAEGKEGVKKDGKNTPETGADIASDIPLESYVPSLPL